MDDGRTAVDTERVGMSPADQFVAGTREATCDLDPALLPPCPATTADIGPEQPE